MITRMKPHPKEPLRSQRGRLGVEETRGRSGIRENAMGAEPFFAEASIFA